METADRIPPHRQITLREGLRLPGAKAVLTAFFCYCALEATAGLWASSYMVLHKGISPQTAAKWASFFYLGITLGRLASGFVTDRLGDRNMVRCGQLTAFAGTVILLLPAGDGAVLTGLIMVGLGCAPIYPSLLHETPDNFWGAVFPVHDGHADGLRLCGIHIYASAVWGGGRAYQRNAVSRVSGHICCIDDWDDRKDGEGSEWKS